MEPCGGADDFFASFGHIMTKPTLMQSLLNKPSQSYSSPVQAKQDYHSTKQEMLRIAATAALNSNNTPKPNGQPTTHTPPPPPPTAAKTADVASLPTPRKVDVKLQPSSSRRQHPKPPMPRPTSSTPPPQQLRPPPPTTYRRTPRLSYNEFEELEPSEDSELEDLFFTPNTSPRTSMASSILAFPTGKKPSRKSLRLSDASDIIVLGAGPPTQTGSTMPDATTASRTMSTVPAATAVVLSTRTPSAATSSSHQFSVHNRHQNHAQRALHALSTTSSLSSTSLEAHSVFSDYTGSVEPNVIHQPELWNDRSNGKEGTRPGHTRHGSAVLKSAAVVGPAAIPTQTQTQTQTVKSTTTSKRKSSQQGLTDGDSTKDIKRPVPPLAVSVPASSTPNGSVTAAAVKATVTTNTGSSSTSSTIGPPQVLASRKSSKTHVATGSKEKMKQDVVVEAEAANAYKAKGKGKEMEMDSSTPSRSKDKGKAKAVTSTPTPTPITHHGIGNGNTMVSERLGGTPPPKTTYSPPTPHTFSAFAPLATPAPAPTSSSTTSTAPPPTAKMNGKANDNNSNHKVPLSSAAFSFPPPPSHSPNQPSPPHQQSQLRKNSLNGSAAAYTYAHRQKSNIPKPSGGGGIGLSNSVLMNMAALLEEDEVDIDGGGSTPKRRLRRTTNGGGQERKRRTSFDSMSSMSTSSYHSYSGSPSRSKANSNSNATSHSNSNTTAASQSRSQTVHSETSTFRSPPKTLSSEVNAMSLSTPGELPSKGTQGYTSLVLPRAPPPLASHSTSVRTISTSVGSGSTRKWFGSVGGKEGKIDLTMSGVAQTTMASVEVVRGLGQQGQNGFGGKLLGMFGRRRSISGGSAGPRPIEGLGKAVDDARHLNEDLSSKTKAPPQPTTTGGVESTVLGFTSYRKPPGYVPGSSVLVQVWAVGVDGIDGRLVGVKFGDDIWSRERERQMVGGGGSGYEDGGAETEWEQERGAEGDGNEVDVSRSTPHQNANYKGLVGLGRSFSLKMRTKQSGNVGGVGGKPDVQRATGVNMNGKQQPNQQDHQQARGRPQARPQSQQPSRSISLKRNNAEQSTSQSQQNTLTKSPYQKQVQRRRVLEKRQKRAPHAGVGYIPGRSFVGRVLECGWDVRDEVVRKGEWVVGLLDVKKSGALTEFIVVDRHRIHRVPHPRKIPQHGSDHSNSAAAATKAAMPFQDDDNDMSTLTLEELALLPLCGIPAYRAIRTFIYAFSSLREGGMALPSIGAGSVSDRRGGGIEFGTKSSSKLTTEHPHDRRRRVLVLRGHDGVGAMAVQILAKRGWKVSVHVPFSSSSVNHPTTTIPAEYISFPRNIQERAKDWGADEIIYDEEVGDGIDDGRIAAIRVIESLREDGDVFDAILDTVGGKEVREAGERLLRSTGSSTASPKGVGQFTTLVGDVPERPIPTAGDHFRAGIRSLRFDGVGGAGSAGTGTGDEGAADMKGNRVGYAWVSVAQDVDWEGEDTGDTLASVLRLALEDGVKPVVEDDHRVVPFEKAPYAFVDRGPLGHGRNVVIKIAG